VTDRYSKHSIIKTIEYQTDMKLVSFLDAFNSFLRTPVTYLEASRLNDVLIVLANCEAQTLEELAPLVKDDYANHTPEDFQRLLQDRIRVNHSAKLAKIEALWTDIQAQIDSIDAQIEGFISEYDRIPNHDLPEDEPRRLMRELEEFKQRKQSA